MRGHGDKIGDALAQGIDQVRETDAADRGVDRRVVGTSQDGLCHEHPPCQHVGQPQGARRRGAPPGRWPSGTMRGVCGESGHPARTSDHQSARRVLAGVVDQCRQSLSSGTVGNKSGASLDLAFKLLFGARSPCVRANVPTTA